RRNRHFQGMISMPPSLALKKGWLLVPAVRIWCDSALFWPKPIAGMGTTLQRFVRRKRPLLGPRTERKAGTERRLKRPLPPVRSESTKARSLLPEIGLKAERRQRP